VVGAKDLSRGVFKLLNASFGTPSGLGCRRPLGGSRIHAPAKAELRLRSFKHSSQILLLLFLECCLAILPDNLWEFTGFF